MTFGFGFICLYSLSRKWLCNGSDFFVFWGFFCLFVVFFFWGGGGSFVVKSHLTCKQ